MSSSTDLPQAVDALARILDDYDSRDQFVQGANLVEIEPLALIMLAIDREQVAQALILEWAESDLDAEEHAERLAAWGVTQKRILNDDGYFEISAAPDRKVLFP